MANKRKLFIGIIIGGILLIIGYGVGFYLKKQKSVLKMVPAGMDYCITVNKEQVFKEILTGGEIRKDSLYTRIIQRVPAKLIAVITGSGISTLGDFAFFGKGQQINFCWVGDNKLAFEDTLKKLKLKVSHTNQYDRVILGKNQYLSYNWPVLLFSSDEKTTPELFFNNRKPKVKPGDLKHESTGDCILYGFIIPQSLQGDLLKYLPIKGKGYLGFKKSDKGLKVIYAQPEVVIKGKLGKPPRLKHTFAVCSWPVNYQQLSQIKQIPEPVASKLNTWLKVPVNHLYCEVLDTISSNQKIITYDMDAEFQLTQKVHYTYKTYPGIYLSFKKQTPDQNSFEQPTDLGFEILKLKFIESGNYYTIFSEPHQMLTLPDYYVYANFEMLKSDPFWKNLAQTNFNSMQLYAQPLKKGNMFVLEFEK